MTMPSFDPRSSLDDLVDDLVPVRPVAPFDAWTLVLGLTALAIAVVAYRYGLRTDIAEGKPAGLVVLRSGVLLLLGSASLSAVVAAARPGVGQASSGWRWALGAALLFPLAALVLSVNDGTMPMEAITSPRAIWCLGIGGGSGMLIGAALTAWLRRGAPVALARTGWLVGLAAGAFGTFAYSLHCPSLTVQYIGIWYTAAVGLCAVAGRLVVPGLVRW